MSWVLYILCFLFGIVCSLIYLFLYANTRTSSTPYMPKGYLLIKGKYGWVRIGEYIEFTGNKLRLASYNDIWQYLEEEHEFGIGDANGVWFDEHAILRFNCFSLDNTAVFEMEKVADYG